MTTRQTAGIFPGQGSQSVGMGQAFSEARTVIRATFAEADAVLGFPLSALCFTGPDAELKCTTNAQPALLTVSTAYWRALQEDGLTCGMVAGHSLGEYSALVAAGALTFPDALRLVRRRGELMEAAANNHPGGMAAVLGMADADVAALCVEVAATHGTLVAANYNAPGQVVVSGVAAAIAAVREIARARGGRVLPLPVSGAFHSPLMAEAAAGFATALAEVVIHTPTVPVVQNVTALPTSDPTTLREGLARQITGSVLWTSSVQGMAAAGITRFVEVGPGAVLTGLLKRILPEAAAVSASDLLATAGA
jgi:[acyl-carrier-protein] S-malonyltransferase